MAFYSVLNVGHESFFTKTSRAFLVLLGLSVQGLVDAGL